MKKLITCLVVSLLSGATFATTWTVDDDGKADFDNIQDAIDAASDGDEIIVMPGTYTGTGAEVVNMLGKSVWLHSSGGAGVTIIDGEGTRRGIYCHNSETSNTIIEGFAITNGYTSGYGGGMYNYDNSNPTLTDCTFTNNTADSGGGMWNELNSNPTLTNCTFTGNTTNTRGGGMHNHNSSPTLMNCTFENNTSYGDGGGMYNYSSDPTLTNCTFENNTAVDGGGMYNYLSSPTLTDTTVCGNTPDQIYGNWTDKGGNTVADVCPVCPDINGDGHVGITDLLAVIDVWGCTDCSDVDVNQDGIVNLDDLVIVFNAWGPCP